MSDPWSVDQQRRHNLASFARHPEPRRLPAPRFSFEQLLVADRWYQSRVNERKTSHE